MDLRGLCLAPSDRDTLRAMLARNAEARRACLTAEWQRRRAEWDGWTPVHPPIWDDDDRPPRWSVWSDAER